MIFNVLHIFTHFGRTYTFRNGVVTCDNETMLQFTYKAMSDGNVKEGHFPKNAICGWTYDSQDEAFTLRGRMATNEDLKKDLKTPDDAIGPVGSADPAGFGVGRARTMPGG